MMETELRITISKTMQYRSLEDQLTPPASPSLRKCSQSILKPPRLLFPKFAPSTPSKVKWEENISTCKYFHSNESSEVLVDEKMCYCSDEEEQDDDDDDEDMRDDSETDES